MRSHGTNSQCPLDCGGCSCHINPPCSHCVGHGCPICGEHDCNDPEHTVLIEEGNY